MSFGSTEFTQSAIRAERAMRPAIGRIGRLLLPRVVGGVDVIDLPRAGRRYLDYRFPLCPREVSHAGFHEQVAPGGEPPRGFLVELLAPAEMEPAGDDRDTLHVRVPNGRAPCTRSEAGGASRSSPPS